jgi:hypothetical protein
VLVTSKKPTWVIEKPVIDENAEPEIIEEVVLVKKTRKKVKVST